MIRAVVDEVVPLDAVLMLSSDRVVMDPFPDDWRGFADGAVIASAMERGYAWLVTCDKRMAFQQNLSGQAISVLVLPTPQLPELARIQRKVQAVLGGPLPGHFVFLDNSGLLVGKPTPQLIGPAKRTR